MTCETKRFIAVGVALQGVFALATVILRFAM